MTKTLSPVFSVPEAAALVEVDAVALDELAADEAELEELEELEEQAASATATGTVTASHVARLSFILFVSFQLRLRFRVGTA